MNDQNEVRISEHYGFKRFGQVLKGWIGSGFKRAYSEIEARRVVTNNKNETQVQFSITHFKGEKERMYVQHGSLTLTPEQARELAMAIYPEGFKS